MKKLRVIFLFPQKRFISINVSWQCLKMKTLMSDFSSVYCSILSKMVCTFLMTFCKNSKRISCKIIFGNNIDPNREQVPLKLFQAKSISQLCIRFPRVLSGGWWANLDIIYSCKVEIDRHLIEAWGVIFICWNFNVPSPLKIVLYQYDSFHSYLSKAKPTKTESTHDLLT